jgi:O-antigen/teichoic acid export membrane protein
MQSYFLKTIIYACIPSSLHPFLKRVENSGTGSRLARGVFWSVAGTVISRGLMLLATIAVARLLGKSGYGELGMIQSTVGTFGVFAAFGLGMTATKHVAEFREKDPERAGRTIAMAWVVTAVTGGVMALALALFAPWLAVHMINAPHLANLLQIGSLLLFFNALNSAQTGALSGFEAFKTIAKVNLAVGFLSFPILILGAYLGGLTGAVWALVINLCCNWLLNHVALRREAARFHVPLAFRLWQKELPMLWSFSLPAVLAGSLVGPVNWLCSALLVNQPNGYAEMGIFSAADQLCYLVSFLPGMLCSVVLPMMSNQLGNNNRKKSTQLLWVSIRLNVLTVTPIILIASILSPFIMGLYGESFRSSWQVLVIMLLATGISAVNMAIGQTLAATNRMWIGFMMNAVWACVYLVVTYFLADNGAMGIAIARGVAYVCHTCWQFFFAFYALRHFASSCDAVS